MQPLYFVIKMLVSMSSNDKCHFQLQFLETSLNRLIKIVHDQRWVGNILKTKSIKNLVNDYKDQ